VNIDQTFLSPHPETVAWQARREKCRSCKHLLKSPSVKGKEHDPFMRCGLWPLVSVQQPGKLHYAYCIDARLPGAQCGPDAALWRAA
jgi:hypothetical protein